MNIFIVEVRHYFVTLIQGEDGATGYKAKDITLEILRDFDYLDR